MRGDARLRGAATHEGGHVGAADSAQHALRWALLYEFLWSRLTGA